MPSAMTRPGPQHSGDILALCDQYARDAAAYRECDLRRALLLEQATDDLPLRLDAMARAFAQTPLADLDQARQLAQQMVRYADVIRPEDEPALILADAMRTISAFLDRASV